MSSPWDLFDDAEGEAPPLVPAADGASPAAADGASPAAADGASPATPALAKLVSIPYTRSYTHIARFLDAHLEPTLQDVKSLSRSVCGKVSELTNGVLISLEALDKIDGDVRKLWLEERKQSNSSAKAKGKGGGGGGGAALSAAEKAEKEASHEAQVEANLNALFGIATRIQQETWSYLQANGQWPHVAFRESFVFAQLIRGCVLAHEGKMREAMQCLDLALILGAPTEETEELTRMIELGVLAHNAASTAIAKKQQQLEQQKKDKEAAAAAAAGSASSAAPIVEEVPLPMIPAVLGADAALRISETMKKSTAVSAVSAPGTTEGTNTTTTTTTATGSTLIERVACPGFGSFAAGSSSKGKKGGKKPTAADAEEEAEADAEHPTLRAIRALTDPLAKPVAPADFRRLYLNTRKPVVLRGALKDWPALKKWRDLGYWSKHYGHRTVPIEIGQHLSGFWREEPMLFSDFIRSYLVPSLSEWGWGKWVGLEGVDDDEASKAVAAGGIDKGSISLVSPARVAYLAQHGLFEQIPSLIEDISIPDYCPGAASLVVNTWMGTAGTVTRLHYDSYHNLFSNAFGYKAVRLYAPSETPKLYPLRKEEAGPARRETVAATKEAEEPAPGSSSAPSDNSKRAAAALKGSKKKGGDAGAGEGGSGTGGSEGSGGGGDVTTGQGNVSAFNVDKPDYEAHPLAKDAVFLETVVGPGDLLFIPKGYWHHIRSLTPCCSVNFWWSENK